MFVAIAGIVAILVLLYLVGLLDPNLKHAKEMDNRVTNAKMESANELFRCGYEDCKSYSRYWQMDIAYLQMKLEEKKPLDFNGKVEDIHLVCPHCDRQNKLATATASAAWLEHEPDCVSLKDKKDLASIISLRSKLKKEIRELKESKEFEEYQKIKEQRRLKKHHDFQGTAETGKKTNLIPSDGFRVTFDTAELEALEYANENGMRTKVEGGHLYIMVGREWKIVVKDGFNKMRSVKESNGTWTGQYDPPNRTLHNNAAAGKRWHAVEPVGGGVFLKGEDKEAMVQHAFSLGYSHDEINTFLKVEVTKGAPDIYTLSISTPPGWFKPFQASDFYEKH